MKSAYRGRVTFCMYKVFKNSVFGANFRLCRKLKSVAIGIYFSQFHSRATKKTPSLYDSGVGYLSKTSNSAAKIRIKHCPEGLVFLAAMKKGLRRTVLRQWCSTTLLYKARKRHQKHVTGPWFVYQLYTGSKNFQGKVGSDLQYLTGL